MAVQDATVAAGRAEGGWLGALRADWQLQLEATPAPTGQEEEWRRTSLDGLPWDAPQAGPASAEFVLPDHLAAAGVVFTDLATAARELPELVGRHLGKRHTIDSHAHFWARAHAQWRSGTFLYVPRGVTVDETLVARIDLGEREAAFHPISLIVAEDGSTVTLMEEIQSADEHASGRGGSSDVVAGEGSTVTLQEEIQPAAGVAARFGGISDVVAGQGARVRYARLQRLGDAAWNVGAQRVEVGQDAEVTTLTAEVGSAVTKLGVEVRMSGKGGTSRLLGLLAAGGSQHIDINSVQDLIGSHTTSD